MNRRQFLKVGSILVAAPAIVRIESLMPVLRTHQYVKIIVLNSFDSTIIYWNTVSVKKESLFVADPHDGDIFFHDGVNYKQLLTMEVPA